MNDSSIMADYCIRDVCVAGCVAMAIVTGDQYWIDTCSRFYKLQLMVISK